MEARNFTTGSPAISNKVIWTGRIISYLCVLFLLFDAIMKIIRESHSVNGSVQLGWPDPAVSGLGILLLICTIFYLVPRTAVLGAILITGYLGGAISIMFRVSMPYYFPIVFGIFVWAGLWLRDENLRSLIPFKKNQQF